MGNSKSRVVGCLVPQGSKKHGLRLDSLEPTDEGLGHSFCYVRPVILDSPAITPFDSGRFTAYSSTLGDSETHSGSFRKEVVDESVQRTCRHCCSETTFKTISGASVSANASAAQTGNTDVLLMCDAKQPAASFESTASFAAIPLQPTPTGSGSLNGFMSGPLERGFASGPLEKGASFMSGPLDRSMLMSGPMDGIDRSNFSAPLAFGRKKRTVVHLVRTMGRPVKNASRSLSKRMKNWILTQSLWLPKDAKFQVDGLESNLQDGSSGSAYSSSHNLQWAHGKAGEDRVHVVLSEEQGWLFIGIYDGFSGPDAPDFLMSNLYKAIDKELEGLLWEYGGDAMEGNSCMSTNMGEPDHPKKTKDCVGMGCQTCPVTDDGGMAKEYVKEDTGTGNMIQQVDERCCEEWVDNGKVDEIGVELHRMCSGSKGDCNLHSYKRGVEGNFSLDAQMHVAPLTCALNSDEGRKNMRLFELLQMDLMSGFKDMDSSLKSDGLVGCDLVEAKCAVLLQDDGTKKKSSGTLFEDCIEGKRCQPLPSLPSYKHFTRGFAFGGNPKKMCGEDKSWHRKPLPWSYAWNREQSSGSERKQIISTVDAPSIVRRCKTGPIDHAAVLNAMSNALKKTEAAYMDIVESALEKNPELALMGSCVLVMLINDEDVYVMNVGDSRLILAQERISDRANNPNYLKEDTGPGKRSREPLGRVELDKISEESPMHNRNTRNCRVNTNTEISVYELKTKAIQLTRDHSTNIEEEVLRIKLEHGEDSQAIFKDRVKGQLKVTRAFGAAFLKKPQFNKALLEMFRIDYVGNSPYICCNPSVRHHRLSLKDRFLILSSDGLYQYFSNEEAVWHVAWFLENVPEGDPAQYLITQLLSRAAKENGMDFHELLCIPHGDRRRYHDDASVVVISLEGRIWRSCG